MFHCIIIVDNVSIDEAMFEMNFAFFTRSSHGLMVLYLAVHRSQCAPTDARGSSTQQLISWRHLEQAQRDRHQWHPHSLHRDLLSFG